MSKRDFSTIETHVAKRTHKRPCDACGYPIEAGDRYIKISGVFEGHFFSFKMLEICWDIICTREQNEFNPEDWPDYLEAWKEEVVYMDNFRPSWPSIPTHTLRTFFKLRIDYPQITHVEMVLHQKVERIFY